MVKAVTGGISVEYTYDGYGRIASKVTKNGTATVLTETYTYHVNTIDYPSNQVKSLQVKSNGRDVTYTYTYDKNGNITKVTYGSYETTYTYDSANQLTRENNKEKNKTWVWEYDDAGNILSKKEYAYTDGTLGTATSTISYTYDATWGDLLDTWNGEDIVSDTIGNMTSDGTWSYSWKNGRELASMSKSGASWSFTYDADGMRTKRTNGSTTYNYVYNGGQLSYMGVGSDSFYFSYDASGSPVSVKYNNTTYYYATNLQGDVTAILNSSGTAVVTYTYDAWGNVTATANSTYATLAERNPLKYRGYVYDQETGLYYVSSRYYDPEIGRFINADCMVSTGQGILGNNMFAYCRNNPVSRIDVTGMADADCYNEDGELLSSDDIENRSGGGGGGKTFNLNGLKGMKYLEKRGWTLDAIKNAIHNGKTGVSTNKATGNESSVYSCPGSQNQYVVIDDVTRSVVQVSNLHDTGWIPDKGITWFQEGKVYK